MTKEFGRIITNLRKKKGLSQKDAAAQLGISQSLLSHYEKGIRECGLEFLVRTADFYEVSTDYLLGRATVQSLNENLGDDDGADVKIVKSNMYCMLNRRLITNSASITYSLLSKINNKKLQKHISDYLSVSQYSMFRKIYSLKENNPDELFRLSQQSYENLCAAALSIQQTKINSVTENIEGIELSPDILLNEYPDSFTPLNELIKNAEKAITQNVKI